MIRSFAVCLLIVLGLSARGNAQLLTPHPQHFTRADSLRGGLRPERTCYDVTFYNLDVRIDPAGKAISGTNAIAFRTLAETRRLQVDLFRNMAIDRITLDGGAPCTYTREENAVFVSTPHALLPGEQHLLQVAYHGEPKVARRPPWDGGFIWTRDSTGNPWVAVACEGTGASLWWPCKDHPADEPDSMAISVTVPPGLEDVSNGRLRARKVLPDGWTRFDWFVSAPINNYDVTVNVARFVHFNDVYRDSLTLDYYVFPRDLPQARRQFAQVKPMLEAFERYFGPYPFRRDGYKLVQSPHLGMEHQSCVAYGNGFLPGYRGWAMSAVGLTFDFIIVHESAHEWWGNSVSASDNADMWIHESFGAYAEALFVEYWHGRDSSLQYINAKRPSVRNDAPIQGTYGVNNEGAGDMYNKGQLVLNTLRSVINNDSLWFSILRGMQERYRWRTISYDTVVQYMSMRTGMNLAPFFDQYLRHAALPKFMVMVEKKGQETTARYHWQTEVPGFAIPVKARAAGAAVTLPADTAWHTVKLPEGTDPASFALEDSLCLIDATVMYSYVDPRATGPHFR